ncbi:2-C-methyl-D-erythritol 2,4-cyclodiphosphate synthase [Bifidobacterium simiarum]|uniref:2-C-methyl-D-erythritol 2,4-cyclodiphosphate synthase n=1 Tax=Bifidobacterium simiarum TaxID=2045441 RepID=A0A2M9HE46_9BIFI|nr:2-C-methyl-D-erythritol 2,4-cyclodiphosphate synthase [Bifidobacterium simiarum]PJM75089.1 2-C-methyl-D-erythritol 2,4-cyclodiphosphate synthase [Bifidobacterium simiarum]
MRLGQGFDAHRFAAADSDRELWLACMRWTDDEARGVRGLEGDSDGDVAAHAVIDAVMSACGLGDIGTLFGVGSDSSGAGRHGDEMLRMLGEYVGGRGWRIVNASVTVVGNAPRMSAHRDEAVRAMSRALGAPVSITATTTDGMGFTGEGQGVAAIAGALCIPADR